jgi:heat shock protein HtpX
MAQPVSGNIFEQQQTNRRNTVLVMAVFIGFVGFLGLGFDVLILGLGQRGSFHLPVATLLAVGFGSMSAFWSLQAGAASVLRSSGAVAVAADDPQYRQLRNVVEEMSVAAGLPVPSVYIIPDPDPNAFATGKDPAHASVAVTQGLVDQLSRDELQAVVAHEMSHVRNEDIRLMTVVAALVGAAMLLSQFGMRSMQFGGAGGGRRSDSSRRSGGGGVIFLVFWLLAMILAPIISRILAMAVSRRREYLADASGAELTRNPGALAAALEKIDAATDPTRSIKQGTAHLCIADPLGAAANDREGWLADLFATHPPIKKRIDALRAMAFQARPDPTALKQPSPGS